MLTKIYMNHFKSFKNKTEIDLKKTNYTILPQNVSENGVLKGCVFVGANAAGKSNIILAVKLLLDFLFLERNINSGLFQCLFCEKPGYQLGYEFLIEGKKIYYCFEIDPSKNMISEKLYLDSKLLMERMGLSAKSYIADPNGINYDDNDVGEETLFLRTLYFNTKFASNPILEKWMDFLKKSVYINLFKNEIVPYGNSNLLLTKFLDGDGCGVINQFFEEYHFEQTIEYQHKTQGGKIMLVAGDSDREKAIFFRRKEVDIPIPFKEESLGNQNLLRILPAFLSVIQNNGMLLIDEFSSGFHNELESLLIRYFMERSEHSQMLFVTHSTNLLNNSILRPDQEYAVEFHPETGSTVKRFSSEQPRSAQNIEKMYVSGVFGAVPDYREVDDEAE